MARGKRTYHRSSKCAGQVNCEMRRAKSMVGWNSWPQFIVRKHNRTLRFETRRLIQLGEYDHLPQRSKPAAWEVY